MTTTEQRRARLIQQIRDAFAGVGREGGVSLHETAISDEFGSDQYRAEARAAARAIDTERAWEDIPAADIERFVNILAFGDPIGYRYYLPAYMGWALENYEGSGSTSVNSAIYALGRSDDRERYALFDLEQCRAICAFLRFMAEDTAGYADESEARRALESYWGRFCE